MRTYCCSVILYIYECLNSNRVCTICVCVCVFVFVRLFKSSRWFVYKCTVIEWKIIRWKNRINIKRIYVNIRIKSKHRIILFFFQNKIILIYEYAIRSIKIKTINAINTFLHISCRKPFYLLGVEVLPVFYTQYYIIILYNICKFWPKKTNVFFLKGGGERKD